MDVPHFKIIGAEWVLQGKKKLYRRLIHWKLQPEDGWKFITAELPDQTQRVARLEKFRKLCEVVGQLGRDGFEYDGRRYFFVSSSGLSATVRISYFKQVFAILGCSSN